MLCTVSKIIDLEFLPYFNCVYAYFVLLNLSAQFAIDV